MESTTANLAALAAAYEAARQERDRLKEELDRAEAAFRDAESDLATHMAASEITSVTHQGTTYSLRHEVYVSPKGGMADALCAWLRQHGAGDLVKETVHPSTLRAYVKEVMEAGELSDELEALVHVYEALKIARREKR